MRLENILASHALRNPEKIALVAGAQRVPYGRLHADILALANGLHKAGVGPGDRVLVYLPNGVEFVQVIYAVFALGAIVVPVNTRLTPKELAYFAQDSQPVVLFVHSDSLESVLAVEADMPACKWVVVGKAVAGKATFDSLLADGIERLPEVPASAEDCMIMYTSGTTGKPKGAVITSANLIVQHCYVNAIDWDLNSNDCFLVTTPLAHRTGLARLMNALCLNATLVAMERFDAGKALALIEQEQVSALGMVPTVARMLLPSIKTRPEACKSLRHIIVTGEAFPVELKKVLIDLLPQVKLHSFFAMTEVGSVTSLGHAEQFTHPASVGRPTPGVEVKLVDGEGNEVPVGEAGEMLVRTGVPGRFTTMRCYYNRPEETAATIVDGWVRTGDMARIDEQGYFYIVDRKKDMVISGGFNIYTKEVEQVLVEHPAVADVAVIGVPDAIYGEAVAAFIEVHPGSVINAADVAEHCKSRIASYKKPKHVFFVETLPRNALGKVLKTELRTDALRNMAAESVER
ncbi:MAG: AMP-dependent synthetase [Herminiimonas sp.]|nr:AMP-dependent synthetase [Herminiimonas sp.]